MRNCCLHNKANYFITLFCRSELGGPSPSPPTPPQLSPSSGSPTLIQNLSLLKRTLAEEDNKASAKRFRSPPSSSPIATFGCQMCSFEGHSHDEVVIHTRVHQTTARASPPATDKANPSAKAKPARYECKACEMERRFFSCETTNVFHDHVRRSHAAKESSFPCSECALQLLSLSVLQMHLHIVHAIQDPNAFLAASPFYAGMRTIRAAALAGQNPTATVELRVNSQPPQKMRMVAATMSQQHQQSIVSTNDLSSSSGGPSSSSPHS